ncbi:MAG: hypothetical protein ACO3C2_06345, partial [Candidatus Nanopelagicales bacterium]
MKKFKRLAIFLFSISLSLSIITPTQAEELANPLLVPVNSQPGLVLNPVPSEIALGTKFSISGAIDPAKKNVNMPSRGAMHNTPIFPSCMF